MKSYLVVNLLVVVFGLSHGQNLKCGGNPDPDCKYWNFIIFVISRDKKLKMFLKTFPRF